MAGAVLLASAPLPVHGGIDNQAVVDTTTKLITWREQHGFNIPPPKPFSLCVDGDLLAIFDTFLGQRGTHSIRISK
eukprot:5137192-Karenia_brevis.AAC.1